TYKDGEFYTRGIDRKTKYTFNDAAATLAHFVLENKTVVDTWSEHFKEAITITMTDMVYDKDDKTAENDWFKVVYEVKDGRMTVTDFTLYDGTADRNVVSLLVKEGETAKDVKDAAIASINSMATFNAYVGGVSYYAVRIKHFGDDLTPWVEPKNADGTLMDTPTTDVSYGITTDGELKAKNNYLGRYGVLRNNWYELNISSINKFGEPTIKDLPLDGTPDDKTEPEQAIACKINILSWAKRSQNVEL
ncbi:MAG: Mfa1 fimbrilin C-terminal domain-containing protein, partial [Muribaculaceae bacterium]|nr:Mfa1 fimbrilin C-terminal domain-containing protein [Muribaculaceae bacterium]